MTTLIKIIITSILSMSLFSCNFDISINPGVKGNGKVLTQKRSVNEPFTGIKASEGLDVYVTQSDKVNVVVEADENLQDLIITEVDNGILKIHTKKNIGRSKAKKVTVSFKDITSIKSTSGSSVKGTNTVVENDLILESSSGSDIKIDVNTHNLTCKTSSGSDIKVSGNTKSLSVESSSGSDFKGANLIAESSQVKASSGADITVNTLKDLTAKASSGADIKYLGDPEIINKDSSSSGSVKKQ
ncbi:head GIN domain-containing protein [Aestuariibaculum sediminum]|uniref:DUF2807 domain-containing protein n=1 Tax=Aestuariibaculum sediminum TaxID=2770637 RepID=A0A8J6Q0M6_9FLAO|nr:head GIN domain-containing protein [Aestuariibaculum sediminum]MBD0833318.1 DUF2807 domain-containing protein [Aestuariibaculum sediminum]